VYTIVPKAQQKEALSFIQKNLFETPTWLLSKNILDKISSPTTDRVASLQDNMLGSLLSTSRLMRIINAHNRETSGYRIDEYVEDLKLAVWSELATKKPIDTYRRNLQKSFVERLSNLINPGSSSGSTRTGGIVISIGPMTDPAKTDIVSVAKGTLRSLKTEINSALPSYTDKMSRYHLQDVAERIEKALSTK
jgi:hypothetical protein